ncbi:MAG: histidine kinase, partial [Bacteroidota bacterium]
MSYGQEAILRHFTILEGLPDPHIFSIAQPQDGHIWIASAGGIFRFDGHVFHRIPHEDRMRSVPLNLYESDSGEMWIVDYHKAVFRCGDGTVQPYQHNDTLQALIRKYNTYRLRSLVHDRNQHLHLGLIGGGYIEIADSGLVRFDNWDNTPPGTYIREIEGRPFIYFIHSATKYSYAQPDVYIDFRGQKRHYKIPEELEVISPENKKVNVLRDGTLLLTNGNFVFEFPPDGGTVQGHRFPQKVGRILEDRRGRLLIGFEFGGMRVYDRDFRPWPLRFPELAALRVSETIQDRQGGYWIATVDQGLYYSPTIDVWKYGRESGLDGSEISTLENDGAGGVFVVFMSGNIGRIRDSSMVYENLLQLKKLENKHDFAAALYFDPATENLIVGAASGYFNWQNGQLRSVPTDPYARYPYAFVRRKNKPPLTITRNGVAHFNKESGSWNHVPGTPKIKLHDGFETRNGDLWMFNLKKVYKYYADLDSLEERPEALPDSISPYLWEAAQIADHPLWIADRQAGVLALENGKLTPVDSNFQPHRRNNFRDITPVNDEEIWLINLRDVTVLKLQDGEVAERRLLNFMDGLGSLSMQAGHFDGERMWLLGDDALYCTWPDRMPDSFPHQPLIMQKILINDSLFPEMPATLPYDQNSVAFEFQLLDFRMYQRLEYQYRLSGVESEWQTIKNNQVRFPQLQPGKYVFEVRGKNHHLEWGPPLRVAFEIRPAFWQTAWFLGLCIGLGILLAVMISGLVIRRVRRQARLQESNLLYQQQALNAQMNPHFLFNSLNSIQAFVTRNDARASVRFLSKFAKLMRASLEASQQRLIPLSSEMDMLEHYCALEALRFDDSFHYEIK